MSCETNLLRLKEWVRRKIWCAKEKEGYLIMLDLANAYNGVDWEWLFKCLEKCLEGHEIQLLRATYERIGIKYGNKTL